MLNLVTFLSHDSPCGHFHFVVRRPDHCHHGGSSLFILMEGGHSLQKSADGLSWTKLAKVGDLTWGHKKETDFHFKLGKTKDFQYKVGHIGWVLHFKWGISGHKSKLNKQNKTTDTNKSRKKLAKNQDYINPCLVLLRLIVHLHPRIGVWTVFRLLCRLLCRYPFRTVVSICITIGLTYSTRENM